MELIVVLWEWDVFVTLGLCVFVILYRYLLIKHSCILCRAAVFHSERSPNILEMYGNRACVMYSCLWAVVCCILKWLYRTIVLLVRMQYPIAMHSCSIVSVFVCVILVF